MAGPTWHEQDGSPHWHEGAGRSAQLVRVFHATRGEGRQLAWVREYRQGWADVINGKLMRISDVDVRSTAGYDIVTVTWATRTRRALRHEPNSQFEEGKLREDGDEEWHVEAGLAEEQAQNAYNHEDQAWSQEAPNNWGLEATDLVPQPQIFLVQRKWMDQNISEDEDAPTTLPTSQANAEAVLETYLPAGTGTYEASPPKLMHTLPGNNELLCINVHLEEDGDLVVRVARFQWKAGGWNSAIYDTTA